MSELDPLNQPNSEDELEFLVNQYLEGELTAENQQKLEHRLESEEAAQDYFAQRIRFHSELLESNQPLKIELTQKRQVVLEYERGLPKVSVKHDQAAKIGNSQSGKFINLDPSKGVKSSYLLLGSIVILLILLVGLVSYSLSRPDATPVLPAVAPPAILEFRNADFEATDLTTDIDASSVTLLDWQDHFRTSKAKLVDLENYLNDGRKAYSGKNAVALQHWAYLTQRLKYSDGSDLIAKKGLRVRVSGFVMTKDTTVNAQLRFALRVVQSVHPEMLQYEPAKGYITADSATWKPFSIDLKLSDQNLLALASDGKHHRKPKGMMDLTDRELSLSIDNRSGKVLYLDKLSVELVE